MTTSDIDTADIVGKYLSRQTTSTRLNQGADTAEENQAVLESIAIAMQLNPQAALSVILNAKNSLQQLISADVEIIDYITAAIVETQNSDAFPSSTADLVDAQTALVELDKIGRIDTSLQAFIRYQNSVNNFLNTQLGPLLKSNATGDFNRSGLEAKQDLFNSVSLFTQTHALLISRLKTFAEAVENYNSVDLSSIVHGQTIARVRTSLSQIQAGVTSGVVSNTVAALELLAGSASLQSISNARKVYDDTIPLSQGLFIGPQPTSASTHSNQGPVLTTVAAHPHSTTLGADGASAVSFELPYTGRSGSPFVCNNVSQQFFNIPVGVRLYVDITPGPAPGVDGITHYSIPLTSGPAQAWTSVIGDINAVFGISGPLATDFVHSDKAIIILGGTSDTVVRVLPSGPGSFNVVTGVYTADPPSAHALLGFSPNQTSTVVDSFDVTFLRRFLQTNYAATENTTTTLTTDGRLLITSSSTDPALSAISVSGQVMSDFGFASVIAVPAAMQITDASGAVQDPTALGVLVGSVVHAAAFIQPVASVDGVAVEFESSVILPLTKSPVRVVAPVVVATQSAMSVAGVFSGAFDNDLLPLQGLLSPLLTTPSLAQVESAIRAFAVIRDRLTNTANTGLLDQLSSIVISESQEPADSTTQDILQTLEERGLDHAQDLLAQCLFSDFFSLTSETASKSTRFMKTMEVSVSTDLATTTVEADMPDGNLLAGSGPSSVLTSKEVP